MTSRTLALTPADFGVTRPAQARLCDYRGDRRDIERAHRVVVSDGRSSLILKDREGSFQ